MVTIGPENPERIGSPELEKELRNSSAIRKLEARLKEGNPADVVCLDIDGTVYEKVQNPDGSWSKKGNNKDLSAKLSEGNIPCILISGRTDWDQKGDDEMRTIDLTDTDAIVAGAGSVIYWRQRDGNLKLDREFVQLMKNQKVTSHHQPQAEEFTYNPEKIAGICADSLADFRLKGLVQVKIDQNAIGGFTTLDVENMSFENLSRLVTRIRETLSGIKINFSEDLEKVEADKFSGWIQILPLKGGKDGATRFILNKMARAINPASTGEKRLRPYIFGDASIDIWMLSLGSSAKDPYDLHQYALGNLTPYAQRKLDRLAGAFDISVAEREQIQKQIDSGEIQTVESQLRAELGQIVSLPLEQRDRARRDDIVSQLRKISVVKEPIRRRANLHKTQNTGPDGVFEIVSTL